MKLCRYIDNLLFVLCLGAAQALHASDVVSSQNIGMELAQDIAYESVLACRKDGYSVSAVVVDRYGILRAALRDDLAARFTLEIAERKANMTVMSWSDSGGAVGVSGAPGGELDAACARQALENLSERIEFAIE
ncbi:hypothetical protein BOW44_12670 [Solemya velum gill symbiont]|uniref:GlcG/HbpS family heme-binding protein n=1 Tax=Solemya velum gill symbiont TaxID=2340 RepID=UPI0009984A70|nr:heme-binding protein [Solemya velum gill symbiont]OOZ58956.1 hypothetical protein BOW44_12670 [Solemya velum gill symbiont]